MDILQSLVYGFSVALTPQNLFYCFIGTVLGTAVGVLPGLGTITGVAILIPATLGMPPTSALIMLAGIYYGAQYGGSTTAILMNLPGESTAVMTCLDGHQLARQGRAGEALGMAAIASFIAGTASVVALMFVAPTLAMVALNFGPPEYAALMILSLTTIGGLLGESLIKGLITAVLGLMIGTVGIDPQSGVPRFTFGMPELLGGIGFLPVIIGLFGVAEVLQNIEHALGREALARKIHRLLPAAADWIAVRMSIVRGTAIGFFLGTLPGIGATAATMIAYIAERRQSRTPERFGKGAIEGVAAPEAANNASATGAMVPLLTLGIPASGTAAVLLGALILNDVQPGPRLFETNPDLVWGVIASMYLGNVMLLILNLPLIGIWVRLVRVRYGILGPLTLFFAFVGVYATDTNPFDVYVMIVSGVVGYLLRKLQFPEGPLILGLVLGPLLEDQVRRSLTLSLGDPTIFVTRPISGTIMTVALLCLLAPLLRVGWRAARGRSSSVPL
ncbi:MAG TPA: tripartite tricarboxylate transporter permease [Hyphomicrobiaceae bacterium]|jgi:putative tricarboxylic transport membrane protein|nr:tripartite tricarboxylate transporter permease [Hyphomicrobiaceae bacterium]